MSRGPPPHIRRTLWYFPLSARSRTRALRGGPPALRKARTTGPPRPSEPQRPGAQSRSGIGTGRSLMRRYMPQAERWRPCGRRSTRPAGTRTTPGQRGEHGAEWSINQGTSACETGLQGKSSIVLPPAGEPAPSPDACTRAQPKPAQVEIGAPRGPPQHSP
jgi:hypothetical protein